MRPLALLQDGWDEELLLARRRRVLEYVLDGPRRTWHVFAHDITQRDHLRRGRDGRGVELTQGLHGIEDVVELGGEAIELFIVEAEASEVGDVLDVGAGDGHWGEIVAIFAYARRR